jgi:MFS family permease
VVSDSDVAVPVDRLQARTLRLLFCTQILGGMGVAIGVSVGALLAARLGGTAVSGLAQSAAVVGGALLAVPATRIMTGYGRRPGLVFAYLLGAVGGALVVTATAIRSVPLLFLGMLIFGGGTTANLQARYSAVDLADPVRRGRDLSVIVWATTIGAVAAPGLASVADKLGQSVGLPALSGPFGFGAVAFVLAATVLFALLRPDPLLTARRLVSDASVVPGGADTGRASAGAANPDVAGAVVAGPDTSRPTMRDAARVVVARPAARLGVAAVAVGHLVMIGVMSMTPVHIGMGHADADVLRIVGIVLSAHILGMYAFSPVVGWLTDGLGRRPVILGGGGLLLVACAVAGTAGDDTPRLTAGLFLLGLGWSCTMVAGSTLLSESVPVDVRAAAQGLSDLCMGVAGASVGAVSGFVVELSGYPTLNLLAATAVVPLVALALRPVRRTSLGV